MTKPQHTPAPWKINPIGSYGDCHIYSENHGHITSLTCGSAQEKERGLANANLISAAPELLAWIEMELYWLKHIRTRIECDDSVLMGFDQAIKTGNAVLAKAEGAA